MGKLSLSKVLYREINDEIKLAQPNDFTSLPSIEIQFDDLDKLRPIIPYCIDFKKRSIIYIAKYDIDKGIKAPFLYSHERENADYLLETNFENIPLAKNIKNFKAPRFVFSPGRCGSTLLSKICQTAKHTSLSEPDFYTQLANINLSAVKISPADIQRLILFLTTDLLNGSNSTHDGAIIKLRSECCARPNIFIFPNVQQHSIFLIRHFIPWAKSVVLNFGKRNPNIFNHLANKYQQSLNSFDFLSKKTECHLLTYEEIISPNTRRAMSLSKAFGFDISEENITDALKEHSQKGTSLADNTLTLTEKQIQAIENCYQDWLKLAPNDLLKNHNLEYLLQPTK